MIIDVAVRFGEAPAVDFYVLGVVHGVGGWHPMRAVLELWGPGRLSALCLCANCFARLMREMAEVTGVA